MKQSIQNFWNNYKALTVILILALAARIVFFSSVLSNFGSSGFANPVNEDAGEYVALAKNFAQSGIFSRELSPPFFPERLRTPGYPIFLAVFYRLIPAIPFLAAVQNIFFLAGIVILYHIGQLVTGNKLSSLIAAGFLAFEPSGLYWNNQLTTESFFTVILLSGIFCFLYFFKYQKKRFIFYSGFFLGFALLIRPVTEYLGIIFLFSFILWSLLLKLVWKKAVLGALLFLLGFSLVAAPWMARNQILFGTTSVSTMNVGFGKYLRAIHNELGIYVDYTNYGGVRRSEVERLSLVRKDALRTIVAHPLIFAKIHLLGLVPFFFGDGYLTAFGVVFPHITEARVITNWSGAPEEFLSFLSGHRGFEGFVFWLGKFVWLNIFILAISGFIQSYRVGGAHRRTALFFLLIVYYFALASGVGSYSRFRFPVNPLLFYFAALGVLVLAKKMKNRANLRSLTGIDYNKRN